LQPEQHWLTILLTAAHNNYNEHTNLYSPKQMVANTMKKEKDKTKKNWIHYRKLDHTVTVAENLLNIKFLILMSDTDNRSDKYKPEPI